MEKCTFAGCEKFAIFLESCCWQHLSDDRKDSFPVRLREEMAKLKAVYYENFHQVVVRNMVFPESLVFSHCLFTEADLKGCWLQRTDFRGSNFDDACLKECHLENTDLRSIESFARHADLSFSHLEGALLQNVDFTDADLRDAILIDADMIGAKLEGVHLYSSRIINTRLRKESLCNFRQIRSSKITVADEKERGSSEKRPLWARFVYAALKNNFRSVGNYEDERWAHIKESMMERKRLFRLAFHRDRHADALAIEHWNRDERNTLYESRIAAFGKWILSWLSCAFAYGESSARVVALSLLTITAFGFGFKKNGFSWTDAFYLSIASFTPLGYIPNRILDSSEILLDSDFWVLFSIESFIGAIMLSFLVVTLTRRIIRS